MPEGGCSICSATPSKISPLLLESATILSPAVRRSLPCPSSGRKATVPAEPLAISIEDIGESVIRNQSATATRCPRSRGLWVTYGAMASARNARSVVAHW